MASPEPSDEALMEALAGGDAQALAPLYVRYGGAVSRMLRRRIRQLSSEEADDLTQEVFVTLLRTAPRYDPEQRLKAWILGIAAGLARNWVRTRGARAGQLRQHRPRTATDGDAPLRRLEARQQVERALDVLSDADREVLVLHVVEGLSGAEVAQALGINANAFYVRLHRARKRILAALDAADSEGGDA